MKKFLTITALVAIGSALFGCASSAEEERTGDVDLSPEQQSQLNPGADGDNVTPTAPETQEQESQDN